MKPLSDYMQVFDFFEANGIFVEVWPTKEALVILLPCLPWWAWIRRSWQQGAVERFRKVAAPGWKLSIVEAGRDDADWAAKTAASIHRHQEAELRREWMEKYGPTGQIWNPSAEQFIRAGFRAGGGSRFDRDYLLDSGRYPREEKLEGQPWNPDKERIKITAVTPATEGLPVREWDFSGEELLERGTPCKATPDCFTQKDFAGAIPNLCKKDACPFANGCTRYWRKA